MNQQEAMEMAPVHFSRQKQKIQLSQDESYAPQYHYRSSSSSEEEELMIEVDQFKKTIKMEEIRLDTEFPRLETDRDLLTTARATPAASAREVKPQPPLSSRSQLETQTLNAELSKSKSCMFGLYLRYIGWPAFSLYTAMVLITIGDALSFVSAALYLVPLFLDSGATASARLCFSFLQVAVYATLTRIEMVMLQTHAYRRWAKAAYVLRVVSIILLALQASWWTEIGGKELESETVIRINRMFWTGAALGFSYQLSSLWVHLSVIYWSRVMRTKQRTLIVIKNMLPKPNQVSLKITTLKSDGLDCPRGHKPSSYERTQRQLSARIHQINLVPVDQGFKRQGSRKFRSNISDSPVKDPRLDMENYLK